MGPKEPEPSAPLTVLYIEDNLSNLQLVERVLRRRPAARLISALRPQLGLDLAAEHDPGLLLLDLHLPDMPGQEVLRRLRAQARTANVPVVVLSADARPALINELLAQGGAGVPDQAAGRPRAAGAAGQRGRRAAADGVLPGRS